jgi:hypothetical protein
MHRDGKRVNVRPATGAQLVLTNPHYSYLEKVRIKNTLLMVRTRSFYISKEASTAKPPFKASIHVQATQNLVHRIFSATRSLKFLMKLSLSQTGMSFHRWRELTSRGIQYHSISKRICSSKHLEMKHPIYECRVIEMKLLNLISRKVRRLSSGKARARDSDVDCMPRN